MYNVHVNIQDSLCLEKLQSYLELEIPSAPWFLIQSGLKTGEWMEVLILITGTW